MSPPPDSAASLAARLAARIRAAGPMSLADYMAACLMDPAQGYYATRDPFGAAGDFITAPEISQMFGELLGLALAQSWLDQGAPSPFTLAEAGPGRGTLMADLLRATAGVPGFHAAARIWLVETSPALRARQRAALAGHRVRWTESVTALPEDRPLWFLANEFFDALPIRQFLRVRGGWRERVVALAPGDDHLTFALTGAAPRTALAHRLPDTSEGDLIELCPAAAPIMAALAERIATRGGAALVIDYGGWRSLGDTLQALAGHAPADPLAAPGQADLTAHVDFEALRQAAPQLAASALTPQGAFLQALGIAQRTRALARNLTGAALESHLAAARRLTAPTEMGTLFKALALWPRGAPGFPGLPAEPEAGLGSWPPGQQRVGPPDGQSDYQPEGRQENQPAGWTTNQPERQPEGQPTTRTTAEPASGAAPARPHGARHA